MQVPAGRLRRNVRLRKEQNALGTGYGRISKICLAGSDSLTARCTWASGLLAPLTGARSIVVVCGDAEAMLVATFTSASEK